MSFSNGQTEGLQRGRQILWIIFQIPSMLGEMLLMQRRSARSLLRSVFRL